MNKQKKERIEWIDLFGYQQIYLVTGHKNTTILYKTLWFTPFIAILGECCNFFLWCLYAIYAFWHPKNLCICTSEQKTHKIFSCQKGTSISFFWRVGRLNGMENPYISISCVGNLRLFRRSTLPSLETLSKLTFWCRPPRLDHCMLFLTAMCISALWRISCR